MSEAKHAVVVVACVAGIGALGAPATVTVSPNPEYASELFGEGHETLEYPAGMTPVVSLNLPANGEHSGSAEITITWGKATLDSAITGLMWDDGDDDTPTQDSDPVVPDGAAPLNVASILDGGKKGDGFIKIKVEEANQPNIGGQPITDDRTNGNAQRIFFELPHLNNLHDTLGGATGDDYKTLWLQARVRVVSGEFAYVGDRYLTASNAPYFVERIIRSLDAVTVTIDQNPTRTIAIDDDAKKGLTKFMSLEEQEKAPAGYSHLATVTVTTQKHRELPGTKPETYAYVEGQRRGTIGAYGADGTTVETQPTGAPSVDGNRAAVPDGDSDGIADTQGVKVPTPVAQNVLTAWDETTPDFEIYKMVSDGSSAAIPLHDLNGDEIKTDLEGLRGTLLMTAAGTRDLFNEGDSLFIDYDKNNKMGNSESIDVDGTNATGTPLSIDPGKSESFDAKGTGVFKVFYKPDGKSHLNHEATIKLTATVNYSDPTAIDEKPQSGMTTLKFNGVANPIRAYAIPHSTNSIGDKGNVRVRCEQPVAPATDCRVFVECWDDMGMRGFGEAPMIAGDSLTRWTAAAIESVTGLEPSSRLSCRVLSRGMVTVQQLTRDGNSGTLVNNTYVGGE